MPNNLALRRHSIRTLTRTELGTAHGGKGTATSCRVTIPCRPTSKTK